MRGAGQQSQSLPQRPSSASERGDPAAIVRMDDDVGGPFPVDHDDLLVTSDGLPGPLRNPDLLGAHSCHAESVPRYPYGNVRIRTLWRLAEALPSANAFSTAMVAVVTRLIRNLIHLALELV